MDHPESVRDRGPPRDWIRLDQNRGRDRMPADPGRYHERKVSYWARAAWGVLLSIVPMAGLIILGLLLWREVNKDSIEIARIDVPARLSESGLSPEVVARRLADHLERSARAARAERAQRPNTELAGTQPDLSVPIAGLSLRGLAALARDVLGLPYTAVTGEIIQLDQKMSIRLRVTGYGEVADYGNFGPADIEPMLARAAPDVWRVVRPQVYAWYVADTITDQEEVRRRLGALRTAGSVSPTTLDTVEYLTGRSLLRSRRYGEAQRLFDRLTRERPQYAPGWTGRARVLFEMGKAADALDAQRQVMVMEGQTPWVRGFMAVILEALGRYPDSLQEADATLRMDPANASARVSAVTALTALGRTEEALDRVERYQAEQPGLADNWHMMGQVYRRMGRSEDAIAAYQRAIAAERRASVTVPQSLLGIGRTLTTMNRNDEALTTLDEAEAHPQAGQTVKFIREQRARTLLRARRPQDSLTAAESALELFAFNAGPWEAKAQALEALNRREEAIAAYRKAVELGPERGFARQQLERLGAMPVAAAGSGQGG